MDVFFSPIEAQLTGGHTISIEPLPPQHEAAVDFLRLQRQVSINTYTGMPCMTQDNESSRITAEDMDAFFDPHDMQVVDYLVQMAETNSDPRQQLGSVLLRAVDLGRERRTVGTLNLKFGGSARPDHPAWAILHDIAVSRDSQRRGIGSLLLRAGLATIGPFHDANDVLRLAVVRSNEPAKAWYNKLEIHPTGRIRTSEWGERAVRVEVEERSAPIGKCQEALIASSIAIS